MAKSRKEKIAMICIVSGILLFVLLLTIPPSVETVDECKERLGAEADEEWCKDQESQQKIKSYIVMFGTFGLLSAGLVLYLLD